MVSKLPSLLTEHSVARTSCPMHGRVWSIICLAVFVAASRIGLLAPGYGMDPDAHRLALAAASIRATGQYAMSREPGHPVQEWVNSLVIPWGAWGCNAATAMMSVLGVVCFALVLQGLKVRAWLLVAAALAFSPLFYVHSVDSMDFVWAMAFSWFGVYCSLRGWVLLAGIALGLAMGCRVTEAFAYIPMLLVYGRASEVPPDRYAWLKLCALGGVLGTAFYVPVFMRYGISALAVHEQGRTQLRLLWQRFSLELWGIPGFSMLVLVVGLTLLNALRMRGRVSRNHRPWNGRLVIACASGVVPPILVFLRLPHDAGYLLPIVPWVLLAVATTAHNWVSITLAMFIGSGSIPVPGLWHSPVLLAHRTRLAQVAEVKHLVAQLRRIREPTLLVAGTYEPKILSELGGQLPSPVQITYLLEPTDIPNLASTHQKLFYLRRAATMNKQYFGVDLAALGGIVFDPLPRRTNQPSQRTQSTE